MSDDAIKLSVRNTEEQNKAVLAKSMRSTENLKELRESIKSECKGLDILDKVNFPVHEPNFSMAAVKKKLKETAVSSGFPQLLRAGVQLAVNNLIENYKGMTYSEWAHTISSDKDTELYAPLHGINFLSERGETEKFSETSIAGLDLKLKNKNFGQILSISQNLYDDDQTGQLQQLAGSLAEWVQLLYEVYCYGKLASIAGGSNYAGLVIPKSETQPSGEANYPFASSAAPLIGGGINRPVAFGALNQANIQAGVEGLMVQKNLLGLIMNVKSQGLICGPIKQFDAMILMNSTNNPSTVASLAGSPAGAFSVNPIKSILDVTVSRYLFNQAGVSNGLSTAWYIMDKSKPWFVLQLRDPGSVVMENPESGESFNRKVVRHRLDVRMNSDYIDPRFVWQGSDGSV